MKGRLALLAAIPLAFCIPGSPLKKGGRHLEGAPNLGGNIRCSDSIPLFQPDASTAERQFDDSEVISHVQLSVRPRAICRVWGANARLMLVDRIRSYLLRKGMTKQAVENLLGWPDVWSWEGTQQYYSYYDHQLTIQFDENERIVQWERDGLFVR